MSTPSVASPPPVRHGICRWTVTIGAMDYRVRPVEPPPEGARAAFVLRKIDPTGPVVTYRVSQPKGATDPACTCPDCERSRSACKHMMALAALGLVRRPKAARPKREPSAAAARKSHAKHARAAIAEAKAMVAEAKALGPQVRSHLAEIAPRPLDELMPRGPVAPPVLYPPAHELALRSAERARRQNPEWACLYLLRLARPGPDR